MTSDKRKELGKQLSSERKTFGVLPWKWNVDLIPKVCEPIMDTFLKRFQGSGDF